MKRIHMGTQNVWRWYFTSPVDTYEISDWHRRPAIKLGGRWRVNPMAPTRFAGMSYPILTIVFHKTAYRLGAWPIHWQLDTVIDFIEENGGTIHVPTTPFGIDDEPEGAT
jgi:hypothetical protein